MPPTPTLGGNTYKDQQTPMYVTHVGKVGSSMEKPQVYFPEIPGKSTGIRHTQHQYSCTHDTDTCRLTPPPPVTLLQLFFLPQRGRPRGTRAYQ